MDDKQGAGEKATRSGTTRRRLTGLTLFGLASGVVVWGGLNTGMEWTNRTEFCVSCHEMTIPFEEYKKTAHFSNRTGSVASCSDCHVASSRTPNDYARKLTRKVVAARDVYGHLLGTLDTREKFEAKRLEMAKREWARMKAADSAECRHCHRFEKMDLGKQKKRARVKHEEAIDDGITCIDCHRGVAHKPVHAELDEMPQDKVAGDKDANRG